MKINAKNGDIFIDEAGEEHYKDVNGNVHIGMPPLITSKKKIDNASGWTIYDNSKGHCTLCGRLCCNGGCFK